MESQTGSSVFQLSGNSNPDYKTLYQELQVKQQFLLSQISHEIRNPVTHINSFLQLFESHHPEIKEDDYWEKIMENMSFLRALLEEFSSYNNSAKLHLQEINLDSIFRETVESLTPLCQTLEISLLYEKETAVPLISADPTKIRQVLLNLLTNAREAIGRQGLIRCSLSCDGENIYLCVKDTGSGIPVSHQKDIFEPFVTYKQGGTGLGLAICKRIISAHGGQIFFRSSAGEDTSFTVVLPIT